MDESWQEPLLKTLRAQLARAPWDGDLESGRCHLAILVEPYFSRLLTGAKTIESRFYRRKWTPFGMVHRGDTLILKRSSGPVGGLCKVAEVHEYDLTEIGLDAVRQRFGAAMGVNEKAFWKYQRQARFVSLFRVERVMPLPPMHCGKHDRRAWVVMHSRGRGDGCQSIVQRAQEMIRREFAVYVKPTTKSAD
jgi:hypothetical protein